MCAQLLKHLADARSNYKPGVCIWKHHHKFNSSTFFYIWGLRAFAGTPGSEASRTGPSPMRAPQPKAHRHAGNSSISWKVGGGPSKRVFLYCFSLTVPTLACRVQHARLVLQRILHFYAITPEATTWESRFFSLAVMTDPRARKTSFHTETVSLLYSVWLLGQRMTQEHHTALLVNIRGWIPLMCPIPLHVMS